jgi:hypothetical protein
MHTVRVASRNVRSLPYEPGIASSSDIVNKHMLNTAFTGLQGRKRKESSLLPAQYGT